MTKYPEYQNLLFGHTSPETAYVVNDYPYGRLRCQIRFWVETDPKKGDRFCSQTTDPKRREIFWNKPKKGVYSRVIIMFMDEKMHVTHFGFNACAEEHIVTRLAYFAGIEDKLNENQKDKIRFWYAAHTAVTARYYEKCYTEERRPLFLKWTKETIEHIAKAPFHELTKHPQAPTRDFKGI